MRHMSKFTGKSFRVVNAKTVSAIVRMLINLHVVERPKEGLQSVLSVSEPPFLV